MESTERSKEIYHKEWVAQAREEDIQIFTKEYNRNIREREFKKEHSVFANWRSDNIKEIKAGLKKDISKWKVPRFVKDEEDYEAVCKIMEENVIFIKTLYITLISNSNYPSVTWNDFTSFVNNWKLLDENLNLTTVDRLFIATKSGGTQDLKDFPERDLSRLEFYEVIVRMASVKYKESGKWEKYSQAVKMLIEDDLMVFSNIQKWQEWREKELWTLDVNDILYANTDNLKKIFKTFYTSKKSNMDLNDAFTLMVRRTGFLPAEKEVITCFGMWKMTVTNEIARRSDYNSISFVEFYEFIARVSEVYHKIGRFYKKDEDNSDSNIQHTDSFVGEIGLETKVDETRNTEILLEHSSSFKNKSTISLVKKIGKVIFNKSIEIFLDALFSVYNLKRKEVKIEIEFDSDDSDD